MNSLSIGKAASWFIIGAVGLLCAVTVFFMTQQLNIANQNFLMRRENVKVYREAIWKLKDINIEILNQERGTVNKRFPSADKLSLVIKELSGKAKDSNIKLSAITPAEKADVPESEKPLLSEFNRVRLNMKLEGSYENLAVFLTHISHLESGIIKTDNFRLEQVVSTVANSSDLELSLEADLYVRKTIDQDLFRDVVIDESLLKDMNAGVSRYEKYLRNPFVEEVVEAAPTIAVEGIIYDPAQPIVLINGDMKHVGDQIGDAKILEIRPDRVLFERGDEKFEILLST